jgi:hypothetical protein
MMKHVAAVIGRPGTGKSRLARELMRVAESRWQQRQLAPFLHGHVAVDAHRALTVLGLYDDDDREVFPGTDRLSMAVAPVAVRWIREQDGHVFFEGDRLGNGRTLRQVSVIPETVLRVWCLVAPEHELQRRYMVRGSAQSRRVLEARATKVANICVNPNFAVRLRENRTPDDLRRIAQEILSFLLDGP